MITPVTVRFLLTTPQLIFINFSIIKFLSDITISRQSYIFSLMNGGTCLQSISYSDVCWVLIADARVDDMFVKFCFVS